MTAVLVPAFPFPHGFVGLPVRPLPDAGGTTAVLADRPPSPCRTAPRIRSGWCPGRIRDRQAIAVVTDVPARESTWFRPRMSTPVTTSATGRAERTADGVTS